METDIQKLIGESTAYEKKEQIEAKRPKSWLKSVSAFANSEGGLLVFGVSDDGKIIGLSDAEHDAEIISEQIKTKLDPVPYVEINYEQVTKEEKEFTKEGKEFTKEGKEFTKELAEDGVLLPKARKEFLNAQRKIYRYISEKPDITTQQMAERMGITKRHVLRYIKRLTSMNLIAREGGRKMGVWRITDEDYESFFDKSSKEDE